MFTTIVKNHYFIVLTVFMFNMMNVAFAADEILTDGTLRFGTGSEASINDKGNLKQPFYYDSSDSTWYKLTFSNYPLDNAIAIEGDGTNEWNINGTIEENPTLTGQVIDTSGFINTAGNEGYGIITSTGTVTINGVALELKNTYDLGESGSFIKITTKITNTSGSTVSNLRMWVGTRDDYVGTTDNPTKTRGTIENDAFVATSVASEKSSIMKITTAATGVVFFTTSEKGANVISNCCGFSNVYNQDPETGVLTVTNDGSYGLFIRMADLTNGASEEFTWYYGAGELSLLDTIIKNISLAASVTIDVGTIYTMASDEFQDTNDNVFTKIKITTLPNPTQAILKLNGVPVLVDQEIASADYTNLTYEPTDTFTGTDFFTWQGFNGSAYGSDISFNILVNTPPVITGTPASTVVVGDFYTFTPNVIDEGTGETVSFSITNKPSWAIFNTSTGALTGTPSNDDIGTTTGIIITITDSLNASASLTAFNINVATITESGTIDTTGPGTISTTIGGTIPTTTTTTTTTTIEPEKSSGGSMGMMIALLGLGLFRSRRRGM
jgi:hypothetical protein